MPRATHHRSLTRRALIADLGKVTLGVVVLGAAACSDDSDGTTGAAATSPSPSPADDTTAAPTPTQTRASGLLRVDLGFVSAYIVVRGGEAAVVDTGVAGSGNGIEAVLTEAGLDWNAVGHVVLTHHHPDHVGGLGEVVGLATDAMIHAGEADIPEITSPSEITAVADGDDVFGMTVIATPGHTPGHISVHDRDRGVLIAGDALVGGGSGVLGPDPQFTDDLETARQSVQRLAELQFDTLVFGHGEPVEPAADAQVRALAETL